MRNGLGIPSKDNPDVGVVQNPVQQASESTRTESPKKDETPCFIGSVDSLQPSASTLYRTPDLNRDTLAGGGF